PLARTLGMEFERGAKRAERVERFTSLLRHRAFRCPDNETIATAYTGAGGPSFSPTLWISYAMPTTFHYLNNKTAPSWFTTGQDGRLYSFRHGTREHDRPGNAYRMNVAFFDGHVECMGDLDAANPDLWAPRGSTLFPSEAHPDVYLRYFAGRPSPYVVP